MSIKPPTDIILDVVHAADPARRADATNRLVRLGQDGGDFAATLDAVEDVPVRRPMAVATTLRPANAERAEAAKAYRGFEGMVLATFVEYAFPEDSTAFGQGTAGSVWKSMLAEQIGTEMAAHGGIGIADGLAASSLLKKNAERGFVAGLTSAPPGKTET